MSQDPYADHEAFMLIDSMSKKHLKEFAKRTYAELLSMREDHERLISRYSQQTQDYLSRCTSNGGVTLPPNFK